MTNPLSDLSKVDVHEILSLGILALNTALSPSGTDDAGWRELDAKGQQAAQDLVRLREALPLDIRPEAIRELSAALKEMHEQEAISLDTWVEAREVVEAYEGDEIAENGV